MADVLLPQLGEAITEGTITRWFKQVGDTVRLDEPLYEVSPGCSRRSSAASWPTTAWIRPA